jgi:nicotinate-nucleotide pyrophosphorylase
MGANQLEINEVNELIRAVDERIEAVMLDLEKLDEFRNAEAYARSRRKFGILRISRACSTSDGAS